MSYDTKAIRRANPILKLLEARGHKFIESGRFHKTCCPFHDDKTPSFCVTPDKGLFYCFGCGKSGDVIQFVQFADGQSFEGACEYLGGERHQETRSGSPRQTKKVPMLSNSSPDPLTDAQILVIRKARETLYDGAQLREELCAPRGWDPETLQALATEASGLGFLHEIALRKQNGGTYTVKNALCYCYPKGLKIRFQGPGSETLNPLASGARHRWVCGKATCPWRSNLANFKRSPRIYLSEGEPDAIAMLCSGVEEAGKTSVIAMPSATSFDTGWGQLFAGKTVVFGSHKDSAGDSATSKIIRGLAPYTKQILQWNPTTKLNHDQRHQ